MKRPFLPTATYRLQLCGHLRFEDARSLVQYLAELQVGALYLSPFFHARHGSTHGYDVVNHRRLDPGLGSEADFQQLAEEVRDAGLGLLVDIVPNHMGIDDPDNLWWLDVLENGPASTYSHYFDIDWEPPKDSLRSKVLLPVLGDQFGKVLEDQQLQLEYAEPRFVIRYYERSLPTDPGTWVPILRQLLEEVAPELAADVPERMELESIITSLEHLPARHELDAEKVAARYRESEVARRRLSLLVESSRVVRQGLERTLEWFNGRRDDPTSFDPLERLLTEQPYRLCYWRVATDEINYRRFFDIDSLAAIRVEDPEVFAAVHEMVLRFVAQGWVTGLRIDHADGLLDPKDYLSHLARAVNEARASGAGSTSSTRAATPVVAQTNASEAADRFYIVAEKILAHDESLPADWPIDGTTGYDFLNLLNGLFVDRRGAYALRDSYARFVGRSDTFAHVLYESKRTILATSLSSELFMLSHQLDRISEQHRWSRDFTRLSLNRALREVVACFPVYRTYIRPQDSEVSEEDRRRIQTAIRVAKRRNPAMSPAYFDFIGSVLLLEDPHGMSAENRAERQAFVLKFQQVTPPVMAKGFEDTAFYRFYPLASLNEVGGDPTIPGTTPEQFHRRLREQMVHWPHDMRTTGTHDTKRGEDLRARLDVLSEIPEEWDACIARWQTMATPARGELDGAPVPDANEEYLIYQTLVGTWPVRQGQDFAALAQDEAAASAYVERIVRYLDKALKEAKLHTSWLNPYDEYDQAAAQFVRAVLDGLKSPLAEDIDQFARGIADAGYVNGLAQTLLKMCVPGIPDFYQGSEFWDFNLVDPDNRRPVDFDERRAALAWLKEHAARDLPAMVAELLGQWPDPRLKMLVIWRTLEYRSAHADLFEGDYESLAVEGTRKANVCAVARRHDDAWAVCVVPRLAQPAWREGFTDSAPGTWPLARWWSDTSISLPAEAPRQWRHVISGATLSATEGPEGLWELDLARVLSTFPVALLEGLNAG